MRDNNAHDYIVNINGQQVNINTGIGSINANQEILNKRSIPQTEQIRRRAEDKKKYFVETEVYLSAAKELNSNNILLFKGKAGVGKTSAAIMLASSMPKEYELYMYRGADKGLGDIIQLVSELEEDDYSKRKVYIFDDFLGQTSGNKEEEYLGYLERVIKSVKEHDNIIVIMTSRDTILQNTKVDNPNIATFLEDDVFCADWGEKEDIKGRCEILVNYIRKYQVDEIVPILTGDKSKLDLILYHKCFTPLLIERAIKKCSRVDKKECIDIILNMLEHPKDIWEVEFKGLSQSSYIYAKIIYSLSDVGVRKDIVDECFKYYMDNKGLKYGDSLENIFQGLNELIVMDDYNKVSFIHPSIIDYIKLKISEDDIKDIQKNSLYIEQIKRLDNSEDNNLVRELIESNEFFKYKIMPVTFSNSPIELKKCILIEYLKCILDLHIVIGEEILTEVIRLIFEYYGRLVLIYSADVVIKVLSLNYDFSCILNNTEYMSLLYSCADFRDIWRLIELTEAKEEDCYNYDTMHEYVKSELMDKLSDVATEAVWIVNTLLDNFFKGIFFKLSWC